MFENITKMFGSAFGKVEKDSFRVAIGGKIAVKTSDGFKTYDPESGKLVAVGDLAIPGFGDMFFVMPTRKLVKGDIIILNGEPMCVLEAKDNAVTCMSFETNKIETRAVEQLPFFGKPFYGKLVSLLGLMGAGKGDGDKGLMKMMLMSQVLSGGLFGGAAASGNGAAAPAAGLPIDGNTLLMLTLMKGGDCFDGLGDLFGEIE